MPKYEYLIHEIRKGSRFGAGDSGESVTELGLSGWRLVTTNECLSDQYEGSSPYDREIVQFIFIREIPPESLPS